MHKKLANLMLAAVLLMGCSQTAAGPKAVGCRPVDELLPDQYEMLWEITCEDGTTDYVWQPCTGLEAEMYMREQSDG